MEQLKRHEITITEADDGFVVASGRIGFPADEIHICTDDIEVNDVVRDAITDWKGKA
ncbi:hypothetical protein LCGC14_0345850 [marine sediment metagenome]|uniref:Uncharacterized protein n=1 Tax=marine sediment metagenome TaxID=412755 RepID=A0A0F9WK28_9ZZZZ